MSTTKEIKMSMDEWESLKAAPARVAELEHELLITKAQLGMLQKKLATPPTPENPAMAKSQAFAALEKGLESFCKAKNITKLQWTDGLAQFRETDEGRALSDNYNAVA